MLPSPKLDDREFDDIVAEAMRLIPRYAPEWTNHNLADPGITLIELAAWMTDLILYRLNRVPEKNYVAFLNLLGIKLKPPLSARAVLQFSLVEGGSRQVVPAGTAVATTQADDDEPVSFETARSLVVLPPLLDRCYSYYQETYSDNSRALITEAEDGSPIDPGDGFEVFGGAQRVERFLYLADPRFAGAGDSSLLRVFLGCPEHGGRDLARLLEWEFWNGDRWRELTPARVEVDRGEVAFTGPLNFEPTTVNDIEGLWMRGRLAEVTSGHDTEIDTIRARVEVAGEGIVPDKAVLSLDNDATLFLDLGKNMYPLGREPKVDCIFHMSCEELLGTADAEILIEFLPADVNVIPAPTPSDNLTLAWEYFDGKRWRPLGRSGPRGVRPGAADFGFHDTTMAFSKGGTVSFRRPIDMEPVEVSGETARWIRVRVESGDFGLAGNYTLDNDKWVFKDDRPLRPPAFRQVSFRYREEYRDLRHAVVYNDFNFSDVTEVARTEYTIFQPFTPQADESPSVYLGFNERPPNENLALFFEMAEELGAGSLPEDGAEVETEELSDYHKERLAKWESEQRVVWEYFQGKEWAPLAVTDSTKGFTTSGFVDYVAPDDWHKSMRFTEERFWLRARLEMGGYAKTPRIMHLLENAVEAHHFTTVEDEIVGSSDASPLQQFRLLRGPLLTGEQIWVRERQKPASADIVDLGEDATVAVEGSESDETWVRWKAVESFYESTPRSRHYTIDYQTGALLFGDGLKGMIPPEGLNSIVAREYRVGGGAQGNVNANTLTSLSRALAYIDTVNNPIAAAGGADAETVDEAKDRAPHTIKSRDRAVTAEDFETLALRASTTLARAKCLPDRAFRGAVSLVLLPKAATTDADLTSRLMPSNEMLRYVKKYLDERRLVGTMLNVVKPKYKDVSLKVSLLRRTVGTSDRMRRDIEVGLRRFLHPLVGGRDERGWEFGRSVLKTDLIHFVEEVPGVEGVDSIAMIDESRNARVEQLRLEPDELPYLVHVQVVEKVRDDVL